MSLEVNVGESSGKLTPKALKKALFLIESNRFVGNIHVTKGEEEKHIYFTVGGIRLLTAGTRRKTPIGKLLVRYGKVTPAQMREALQTQKRTGKRVGDVLTKTMKIVEPSDIDEVVRLQVENEIFDVITWEDGVYEFTPSMPDSLFNKKLKATTLSTDIPALIERIKSRVERWPSIHEKVPDLGGVYRLTQTGYRRLMESEDAQSGHKELAGFLDGKRPLHKVITEGEFGTFEVCDMVAAFLADDWIVKVGGAGELTDLPDASDVFEEIQMLERALDLNPDDAAVRTRMVEALEKGGIRDKAGHHLRILAEGRIRSGKIEEAQTLLEKAIRLNPTDFDGNELLLDVYYEHGQDEKAIRHGIKLAETYKANHLFNRGKKVLQKILDVVPDHIRAHMLMGETHEELQETQSALRAFETVAQILKEEGKDESRLREICEHILVLDARHRFARRELNRILRRGQGRMKGVLRFAAFLCLAVLAFGVMGYEYAGRTLFGDMQIEVHRRVKEKDFAGARRTLETFRARFPIVGAAPIGGALAELERRRLDHREVDNLGFARAEEAVFDGPTPEKLKASAQRISKRLEEDEASEGSARARLVDLLARVQGVLLLWENVTAAASAAKPEVAYKHYRDLLRDFPAFHPEREFPTVSIPFEVHPPGAAVVLDGDTLPTGEPRLPLRLGRTHQIQVSHPGFKTLERVLDLSRDPWPLSFVLTKDLAWKADLGGAVDASPVVVGPRVYVAVRNRSVVALDLSGGAIVWRHWLGLRGDLDTSPLVLDDGTVLVSANDGTLTAMDGGTGRGIFRDSLGTLCPHTPLRVGGGDRPGIVLAFSDGKVQLRSLDDGGERKTLFGTESRIFAGPAEFEGILVVGDASGNLVAFDRVAAQVKWTARLEGEVSHAPAIHEGTVYVGTESGKVYALNLAEGAVLHGWPVSCDSPVSTVPVVHGDLLMVGTRKGQIVALHRLKGSFSWRFQADGPIRAAPLAAEDTVYVVCDSGALCALDLVSRGTRWKFQSGGPIRSTPVKADGLVLFGSGDGILYALRE